MKKTILSAIAALALGTGAASAATLYTPNGVNTYSNGSWSFGQIFTVGASNLTVKALGAFDAGMDGFTTAGGILVGLYDELTSTLLASSSVQSSDTLDGNYRYTSISDVTLLAGQQYRVVAVSGSDLYNLTDGIFTSDVTSNGFGYCSSTTLQKCDGFTGNGYAWMANMKYNEGETSPVPVPASLPLLAAGIGGLAMLRRRRKA
ncbi:VPLPA-CTERM sorting domain-containing protein [Seohaeicola nanhaiensis]|uniref:VPLPA-CTERM sorting domain-containing protein n=1 Tax=Seohaeicola nanhaiensis TaxID=1387282 RepID=A0ABV9KFU4_9RHOB